MSELNCPFCGTKLEQMNDKKLMGCPKCLHIADGAFWLKVMKIQEDLHFFIAEQGLATTALINRTKELDTTQKNLRKAVDIATDILEYTDKVLTGGTVGWETHIQKALREIKELVKE